MKKTLAAVAVLGAFAGSALADVTVYGNVDTALAFNHTSSAGDTVAMKNSGWETSLIGFKGSEKIGDVTVGFKLEAAFNMDTGDGSGNDLMKREALLYAKTAYGEFGFGRTGSLNASTGSYAFLGSGNTGWGGGMLGVMDNGFILKGKSSRYDNAITYKSPAMGGVTLFAQVASAENADDEFTHKLNRYYAVGAQYAAGAFKAGLVAMQQDYAQAVAKVADDALVVSGFANYDFGVAKVAVSGQYWDNLAAAAGSEATNVLDADKIAAGTVATKPVAKVDADQGKTGYGLTMAVVAPVTGGELHVGAGYAEQEPVAGGDETTYLSVGTRYFYKLSKQSGLYVGLGYTAEDTGANVTEKTTAVAGIYHKF